MGDQFWHDYVKPHYLINSMDDKNYHDYVQPDNSIIIPEYWDDDDQNIYKILYLLKNITEHHLLTIRSGISLYSDLNLEELYDIIYTKYSCGLLTIRIPLESIFHIYKISALKLIHKLEKNNLTFVGPNKNILFKISDSAYIHSSRSFECRCNFRDIVLFYLENNFMDIIEDIQNNMDDSMEYLFIYPDLLEWLFDSNLKIQFSENTILDYISHGQKDTTIFVKLLNKIYECNQEIFPHMKLTEKYYSFSLMEDPKFATIYIDFCADHNIKIISRKKDFYFMFNELYRDNNIEMDNTYIKKLSGYFYTHVRPEHIYGIIQDIDRYDFNSKFFIEILEMTDRPIPIKRYIHKWPREHYFDIDNFVKNIDYIDAYVNSNIIDLCLDKISNINIIPINHTPESLHVFFSYFKSKGITLKYMYPHNHDQDIDVQLNYPDYDNIYNEIFGEN